MTKKENVFSVAVTKCFLCGESKEIIMNTRLTKHAADNVKAIDGKVIDKEPCDQCKKYMKKGVILITADESKSDDMQNPYRTGGWFVVKDALIKRMGLPKEMEDDLLKKRAGFIEHSAAVKLGLFEMQDKAMYKTVEEFNTAS